MKNIPLFILLFNFTFCAPFSLQAIKKTAFLRESPKESFALQAQIIDKKDFLRLYFKSKKNIPYKITQKERIVEITFEEEGLLQISGPQEKIKVIGNDPKPTRLRLEFQKPFIPRDFRQGRSLVVDFYPQVKEEKKEDISPKKAPSSSSEEGKEDASNFPFALTPTEDTLVFSVGGKKEGGAALFKNNGKVWAFFDQSPPFPTTKISLNHHGVREVEGVPPYGFSLTLEEGYHAFLQKKASQWNLIIKKQEPPLGTDLLPLVKVKSNGHKYLLFHTATAGQLLRIPDPFWGGDLFVIPMTSGTYKFPMPFKTFQLLCLPTQLGLVIKPLCDDLDIRQSPQGVEIHSPQGLWLCSCQENGSLPETPLPPPLSLFDLSQTGYPTKSWIEVRRFLNSEEEKAEGMKKIKNRLILSKFYLGTDFIPEGMDLLKDLLQKNSFLQTDPFTTIYKGIGSFLLEDYSAALQAFHLPALEDEPEIELWKDLTYGLQSRNKPLIKKVFKKKNFIKTYPSFMKAKLVLKMAELGLDTQNTKEIKELLSYVDFPSLSESWKNQVLLLQATLAEKEGKPLESRKILEGIFQKGDTKSRTQARLRLIDYDYQSHKITPKQALQELESLQYQWRGDEVEYTILRQISDLSFKEGLYRKSFDTLESLLRNFPQHPHRSQVLKDLENQFIYLFKDNKAPHFPPLKALSLYEDLKKYAPARENMLPILRRLASQMESMDLLDDAIHLLEDYLHKPTVDDLTKVDIGAQIAEMYLKNNRSEKTLEILSQTAAKKDIAPQVSPSLSQKRRYLEAKADAKLGHYEEAATVVAKDDSPEVLLLKRDLYLGSGQWAAAAQVLQILIDAPSFPQKNPGPQERRLILDLAVATSLAKQKNYLAYLRKKYKPVMDLTEDKDAFHIITLPEDPNTPLTPAAIETEIKKASQFSQALGEYRKRLAQN